MKSTQKGSAHVIIIVILVIALAGALGFIFWQNVVNNHSDVNDGKKSSSVSANESSKTNKPDGSVKYLTIDAWKVKLTLPSGNTAFTYAKPDGPYDSYGFSTKALESNGASLCQANEAPLGSLVRMKEKSTADASPPTPLNNEEPIDGYYYYYQNRQSTCSEDMASNDEQTIGTKLVMDMSATIQSAKS